MNDILGEGTYGQVFIDENTYDEPVAIKVSRERFDASSIREVDFLRRLDHPAIIYILDIFIIDNKVKFATKIALSDMNEYLKNNTLSINEIKSMTHQLFSALSYVHSQNYVHRDVSLRNILLFENKNIKLADFGSVRYIHKYDKIQKNINSKEKAENVFEQHTGNITTITYRDYEQFCLDNEHIYTNTKYSKEIFKLDCYSAGICWLQFHSLNISWKYLDQRDEDKIKSILDDLFSKPLQQSFPNLPSDEINILSKLITRKRKDRLSSSDVLKQKYFQYEIVQYKKQTMQFKNKEKISQLIYIGWERNNIEKYRETIVSYMIKITKKLKGSPEILYNSVNLLDRYICKKYIDRNKLSLISVCCIFVSYKLLEAFESDTIIEQLCFISGNKQNNIFYTEFEFCEMVEEIMKTVNFKLYTHEDERITFYPLLKTKLLTFENNSICDMMIEEHSSYLKEFKYLSMTEEELVLLCTKNVLREYNLIHNNVAKSMVSKFVDKGKELVMKLFV